MAKKKQPIKTKEPKGYFKKVRLFPSVWELHVWISEDEEMLTKRFCEMYGASKEYYKEAGFGDWVACIGSTLESECKGHKKIIMNLRTLQQRVLIHECQHVLFQCKKQFGADVNIKSQEWCALFVEYLWDELHDLETYIKLY